MIPLNKATFSADEIYDLHVVYKVIVKSLLYIFLVYFLVIEVIQAVEDGLWVHLGDFWNYLDLVPPIFIFTSDIIQYVNSDTA